MTRRDVLRIGFSLPGLAALPALAASSREFWNSKPPAEWTKSEIQDLLSRSPWVREVNLSDNGPGVDFGRPNTGGGGSGNSLPGGLPGLPSGPPMGKPFVPQGGLGRFRATVRWDSALPIREALNSKAPKDAEQNYIICLTGDVPDPGRSFGGDGETLDQRRLDSLKQYTRLERKSDAIVLSRVAPTPNGYPSGGGTLFYFERGGASLADDKQVTFVTRAGPYEVRARFNLKEMLYRGKLEL